MASNDDDNDVLTVAALGGGALLAWLLLRGRRGLGGGGGNPQAASTAAGAASSTGTGAARPVGPPCRVFIRGRTIEVNGAPRDLPTMVRECQAAGGAKLGAAGDAIQGTLDDVVRALNRAGIPMLPDAWLAEVARKALTQEVP